MVGYNGRIIVCMIDGLVFRVSVVCQYFLHHREIIAMAFTVFKS